MVTLNSWFVIDDFSDTCDGWPIPFDPNMLSVSPHLHEGDLLLMNADVFHKTGATYSDRISIRFDFTPHLGLFKKYLPSALSNFYDYFSSTKRLVMHFSKNNLSVF